MHIKIINLKDFKRFNDFTIDLGDSAKKIVALVGPNGSGKSSVFDGFEEFSSHFKGRGGKKASYYVKSIYQPDPLPGSQNYDSQTHVFVTSDQEPSAYTKTSFYIRSAHRFTPRLDVNQIQKLSDAENDEKRPQYLIDPDSRLQDNYERLIGRFYDDVYDKELTGKKWSEDNIDGINKVLKKILDITVVFLGNPVKGEGSLYFKKGTSSKFPYENLSAGEKEVVDLVLDIYVKKDIYSDSIICIDEPELHLNTSIQRKLLVEIEKIVPNNSQLWVATHSIGFLRALQEDLKDKTAVIDFIGHNFDETVVLKPISGTRKDWTRIFETALEDLTGLLAPKKIIYCEGRPDPSATGMEQGLDADVYNEIFSHKYPDTLFVSSGGGNAINKSALLALKILRKAFNTVDLYLLRDKDELSTSERDSFIAADPSNKMLLRRELENYLFDKEILKKYCVENSKVFDEAKYDNKVTYIKEQDLKPVQQDIQASCQESGDMAHFKRALAKFISQDTAVFIELESLVF
ncbi:MAG: hypothetical protein RL094_350 [Candidatus Parcubacteria bacterium]|jgi:predicted ATPase